VTESDNRPFWNGKPGHYEPWFLTMSDGRTGYWIRYALIAPTGAPSEGRLWFARFDREDPERTFGMNRGVPVDETDVRTEPFGVRIAGATLASGHARGSIEGNGRRVIWDIEWETGDETHRLLPNAFYRGGLAPTHPYSPNPHTRFRGTIRVDGERHDLHGVPGQQGHQYGSRHAELWAWAHCSAFEGTDAVLHGLVVQGKRGPLKTPFTSFVSLRWRGKWLRFAKASRTHDFVVGSWPIDVGDRGWHLSGRVEVDPSLVIQGRYLDPDGSERFCHNSEVASSELILFQRRRAGFEEVAVLRSDGTTAAEWAGRTPAPGEHRPHEPVDPPPVQSEVTAAVPVEGPGEH
jgi:hypothetical protein